MKKRLLVCMMALVLGLTGCSGSSGNSDNSTVGENISKETKEERDYYGNKYREEYDVAYWTYIGLNAKYMIDGDVRYQKFMDGQKGITSVNSKLIFAAVYANDAHLYGLDFSKEYTEEEMVQLAIPVFESNQKSVYELPIGYKRNTFEFECDDVETIKVGDYEFVQGTGVIIVPPKEESIEEGMEPIRMDAVCHVRKIADGNYFICYQFADTNLVEYGEKSVTIDEMKDYAKEFLKSYKEYECEYSDFNEGV